MIENTSLKIRPTFFNKKSVKKIFRFASENSFNIWIVGGAIRDHFIKKKVKDIDFAFDIEPIKLLNLLKNSNLKVGIDHINYGTLSLTLNKNLYYLTSLREDVETNGRHAKVRFTNKLRLDSERRDLTINALYLNSQNELIDFYNGVEDIKNCSLKFIGNINKRFLEDNLRILRYCRFCSLFEKPRLPVDHVVSLKTNSQLIKNIPKKKLILEFHKIFENKFYQNSLSMIKYVDLEHYFKNDLGLKKYFYNNLNKKLLRISNNYFTFE